MGIHLPCMSPLPAERDPVRWQLLTGSAAARWKSMLRQVQLAGPSSNLGDKHQLIGWLLEPGTMVYTLFIYTHYTALCDHLHSMGSLLFQCELNMYNLNSTEASVNNDYSSNEQDSSIYIDMNLQ